MSIIGPEATGKYLRATAQLVRDGIQSHGLPEVKADAKQMDSASYEQNRKMALEIRAILKKYKTGLKTENYQDKDSVPKGGPLFVLGWRLYPTPHDHWNSHPREPHTCGCACGCWALSQDGDSDRYPGPDLHGSDGGG